MVDQYHIDFPTNPIARRGIGIKMFTSKQAAALAAEELQRLEQEQDKQDRAKAQKAAAILADREKAVATAAKQERDVLKKEACVLAQRAVAGKWEKVNKVCKRGMVEDEQEEAKYPGWQAPGWRQAVWPQEVLETEQERDKMLSHTERGKISMVFDDIRDVEGDTMATYLKDTSARILGLLPTRTTFTLCFLGRTSQTAAVLTTLVACGWKWGAPYQIQLDTDSHSLSRDTLKRVQVHKMCLDAKELGDATQGLDVAVIFRFFRGGMTESKARQAVDVPCWSAGRTANKTQREEDVPDIIHSGVTKQPYHFSLDLSGAMPHADEFPLEFAFSNFLYWHSRRGNVLVVLNDTLDLFGCAALYCGRRVLTVAQFADDAVANQASVKAYTTMALLMSDLGKAYFLEYPADAKFATLSRLVRNTRTSLVDAPAILHSQTMADKVRFGRQGYHQADLATPCRLVGHSPTHDVLYVLVARTKKQPIAYRLFRRTYEELSHNTTLIIG
jgi:hypothetical protein